jgi:N-formylmaleamate deformylase
MLKIQSSDLLINGFKLHFYRCGTGKTPLILLHGITDDGLCWSRVAEALADICDIVMLDARGHGKSEAPDLDFTYDAMAEDVAGLAAALGLEHPCVLGHSMGAATALTLAGLHPDLPRLILLEDPPPMWNFQAPAAEGKVKLPEEVRLGLKEMIDWMEGVKRMTQAELLAGARAENPGWSESELGPWADAKQRFSLRIVDRFLLGRQMAGDFSSLVRRTTCPALFIQADPQQGAASSPQDVAKLKELLPQLQVAPVKGAGHSIHRDRFEAYIQVVRAALAGPAF